MRLIPLLLFAGLFASVAHAANPAHDQSGNYQNPWGPTNPQNWASGFAPWTFETYNPPTRGPAFFIDNTGFAIPMAPGYDAVWVSFTGDGQLDANQSYNTVALFAPPGHSSTGTPTQGFDLFAQSPDVPSKYLDFGHQVLGLYLGQTGAHKYSFGLAIHNTLSDENPDQWINLPLEFTGTTNQPQQVIIHYFQYASGSWKLELRSPNQNAVVLTSAQYGPTWNTTTGIDAVRYFTSQAISRGHPLEWASMRVK